jgi:hypothetical protein
MAVGYRLHAPVARNPIRSWGLILCLGLLLGQGACTVREHQGSAPIYPRLDRTIGKFFPGIDTLQPELRWKDIVTAPSQSYDLCIWKAPRDAGLEGRTAWGEEVYLRTNIRTNVHRIGSPLEYNTRYYWSVRLRDGDKVGAWSTYRATTYAVVSTMSNRNTPFGFKTPKQ